MKFIIGKWVGTIQGTNNGAVFAEFTKNEERVSGRVHINDPTGGVGVYSVNGTESGTDDIRLILTPSGQARMVGHGIVTVLAHMVSQTKLVGDWRSTVGTAGTLSVNKVDANSGGIEENSKKDQQKSSLKVKDDSGDFKVAGRTKVFISYSHCDTSWLDRLRVHLKPLERDYALDIWDDREIQPGSIWLDEIKRAIGLAKVALLLISADFLASDFIAKNELPPLLEAAKKEGAVIMPLIVSPSRFKSTKNLSQFQAFNDSARPLINMSKGEQEELLVKASDEIERVLKP